MRSFSTSVSRIMVNISLSLALTTVSSARREMARLSISAEEPVSRTREFSVVYWPMHALASSVFSYSAWALVVWKA